MPDATLVEAGRSIVDVGVVGAVCIFLMVALGWVVRTWRNDLKEAQQSCAASLSAKDAEIRDEREAHQRTREAHLAELRNMMKMADSVDHLRETLLKVATERGAA